MRPCSRLLSKRRLQLPTIKEGSEETLRDMNHANASFHLSAREQALSSQDYLLSICHLAHPTFPAPPSGDAHGLGWKGSEVRGGGGGGGGGEQTLGASDPLEFLYGGSALTTCWEGEGEERRRRMRRKSGGQSAEGGFSGTRGGDDDQDTWEGRRRARSNTIPRLTSPNCPHRRKGSCPELQTLSGPQTPMQTAPSDALPVTHFEGCLEEERGCTGERGGTEEKQVPGDKPSLVSHWLSECGGRRGLRPACCRP
ncbi:unnamed protein product [Merluccius merluccius]